MAKQTEHGISWTDFTFNPWMGCVKISPACKFCYAEVDRKMRGQLLWGAEAPRQVTSESYWKQPLKWDREARKAGERARVFCGSLCDVMEDYAGMMSCSWADQWTMQDFRDCALYPLIERTPNLDWLLLTKRPDNYLRFLPQSWLENPRRNVWLGSTIESPAYLWRADSLRATPSVTRFLSIEPLLEDLGTLNLDGIHQVIVGGESGHSARPMHPDWARSVRDQCIAAGVAFHFKQNGEWVSVSEIAGAGRHYSFPDGATVRRVGKKAAGRTLDGRTWDEMPEVERLKPHVLALREADRG